MSSRSKKILIDAILQDEIKIAVLDDNKVVGFEQDIKGKKQLKGNIYVALVKRIEPSLQAVFIEYEKNKQGFLPFYEISPIYYQLPEDEKKLLLQQFYSYKKCVQNSKESINSDQSISNQSSDGCAGNNESNLPVYKKHKLQDVIQLNQKILVQLTKEARGYKGASFSTYITLVGKYCVLMPSSNSKGGVSRRIGDDNVRKYLQEVLSSIQLQERTSLIIRTAGAFRKKEEIEQDYRELCSMWKKIQNQQNSITDSRVPALVHSETDIITRSLRDFYDTQVGEIVVSGEEAYKIVREYVRPLRNKLRIELYKGILPIFIYYKVEEQISKLYSNSVELPSGGYLVITSTEALVSIDVNSGKMTGEEGIEETAYKTNMEAVQEIARQVNLRGLSGLIVIDFIDMIKQEHCHEVELAVKEAFKDDRAKIQFGCINSFGLMEISRQRIKPSILETNTVECFYCKGIGKIKSMEVIALSILRELKYAADKNQGKIFNLYAHYWVVAYIFNSKRFIISEIEREYNILFNVDIDNNLDIDNFYLKHGGDVHNCGNSPALDSSRSNQGNQRKNGKMLGKSNRVNSTKKKKPWLIQWLLRLLKLEN
ncbi:Rne/Rng family ribonuclease [Candidatus Mesenet endosymbiont of Agriotes lineatus]|uniref:Rne/Rng family ribonuclease n=1 Tax=Candidatus Mesenet endosymbiont of Agriotes lineatus TaxID=3077948 RepID=UPI0030D2309E